jgi:hypothetical protein
MAISKRNDEGNKEFWALADRARAEMESWPAWKRDLRITKYSIGLDGTGEKTGGSTSKPQEHQTGADRQG